MPIDSASLLGRTSADRIVGYTDRDALLYNISVGMGSDDDPRALPFVFEKPALRIVPTFASVLGAASATVLDGVPIDWSRVVHGEQRLSIHRPLAASQDLTLASDVTEIVDKGLATGAIITVRTIASAAGNAVYTSEMVMVARGDGGCGGATTSAAVRHALPERSPDLVRSSVTRLDQAALFRLNGDRNPLHIDPGFARRAGFPAPILHGLCSYGLACRAVLASVCDFEADRIAAFDARFTGPVLPGDTIETDLWLEGDTVSFRCRVPARDIVAIDNGRCRLLPI